MIEPHVELTQDTLKSQIRSFADNIINKIHYSSYHMTNMDFQILLSNLEDHFFEQFRQLRAKSIERVDKETQELKRSQDYFWKCYELLKKPWGSWFNTYHDALQSY